MSKIPIFTGPDGMPVQPTEDHYRQAIELLVNRIEELERELQQLKEVLHDM